MSEGESVSAIIAPLFAAVDLPAACCLFGRPVGKTRRRDVTKEKQTSTKKIWHALLVFYDLQSNPLNVSPDNGSIWLLVQVLAGPILVLTL